ncbi:MAG: hypothetical protein PHT33_10335 [bacterium]|nr:hypothetical protein [bacterium]
MDKETLYKCIQEDAQELAAALNIGTETDTFAHLQNLLLSDARENGSNQPILEAIDNGSFQGQTGMVDGEGAREVYHYTNTSSEFRYMFQALSKNLSGDDEVLDFLGRQPLSVYKDREWLFRELNDSDTPFYTLDELAYTAMEFVDYLSDNRSSLIRTGFPRTKFHQSGWFQGQLGFHFFTKLPFAVVYNYNSKEFEYIWAQRPGNKQDTIGKPWNYFSAVNILMVDDIKKHVGDDIWICDYDDARFITGLTNKDDVYIEEKREKLLELKIAILKLLCKCIRCEYDHQEIWRHVFECLSEYLSVTEFEYFLSLDERYSRLKTDRYLEELFEIVIEKRSLTRHIARFRGSREMANLFGCGGISNILNIVLHFITESELKVFSSTKRAFHDRISSKIDDMPWSYYNFVGKPLQRELEHVFEDYRTLRSNRAAFNNLMEQNILRDLDEELEDEIVIEGRVEQKYAKAVKKNISGIASIILKQMQEIVDGTYIKDFSDALGDMKRTEEPPGRIQEDYSRQDYQCIDRIFIPGEYPRRRNHPVHVNGTVIGVPDACFPLLLVLVLAAKTEDGGWISQGELVSEGIINDLEDRRRQSSLRLLLRGGQIDKTKDIIENDGGGNYRLSIHPEYITYDKDQITHNLDRYTAAIGERLP